MTRLYKWKLVFKAGYKAKVSKKTITISKGRKKSELAKTLELEKIIKSIIEFKHFVKLNTPARPIDKLLFALGCVEFELVDSKKKAILAIDYYPSKISNQSSKSYELSKQCFFQKIQNAFVLKSSNTDLEIKFFQMDFFEDFKKVDISLRKIIFSILSDNNFLIAREIQSWDFHDDLFHHKTSSKNIYFPKNRRPKITTAKKKVISLDKTKVLLSERRSRRAHSKRAISFKKISALLHGVAQKKRKKHLFYGDHYEGIYPSAGGAYENEFYLLVNNCEKLGLGLYRYDGFKHQLINLGIEDEDALLMLKMAGFRISKNSLPSAVIIVTSKLPILQKKYSKVNYRLALLNVGVIAAYLDLLSNKLKLAGCTTGSLDWKVFEHVTGINHLQETAMLEYVIGESDFLNGKERDEEEKY